MDRWADLRKDAAAASCYHWRGLSRIGTGIRIQGYRYIHASDGKVSGFGLGWRCKDRRSGSKRREGDSRAAGEQSCFGNKASRIGSDVKASTRVTLVKTAMIMLQSGVLGINTMSPSVFPKTHGWGLQSWETFMKIAKLTGDICRRYFDYDPSTGALYHRVRKPADFTCTRLSQAGAAITWNAHYAGKRADHISVQPDGYTIRRVKLMNKTYPAHHIVWLWCGRPRWKHQIEHANGDATDNRIENLSDKPQSANNRNRRKPRTNTSGTSGVSWASKDKVWVGFFRCEGVRYYLGRFKDKEKAAAAVIAKRKEIGRFTNRHIYD